MGGPALIEGGGLGVFRPEEVGPMEIQVPNGVVDLPVRDEAEAVAVAKKYLSYFQGTLPSWKCADQRLLRRAVPENRLQVYKMRDVIHTLAVSIRAGRGPLLDLVDSRIKWKNPSASCGTRSCMLWCRTVGWAGGSAGGALGSACGTARASHPPGHALGPRGGTAPAG